MTATPMRNILIAANPDLQDFADEEIERLIAERDALKATASKMANDLFSIRNYAYSNMLGGDAQVMRLIFEKSEAALVAWKNGK